MSDAVAEAAHANLGAFLRWLATLEPDAALLDDDGIVAEAGAADWPSSRMSIRSRPTLAPDEWAERVDGFFSSRGRTASAYLRRDVDDDLAAPLVARGFFEYSDTPEMVCEQRLDERDPPPGVTLRLARTAADVEAYARVASRAFVDLGFWEDALYAQLHRPEMLLGPDVAVSLAEIGGKAVAGAMSVVLGDTGGGYVGWVACLPEARGRALGDAVTRVVTNEAFDRGAGMVTLEASRFGESTYRRMGYRELYRYRMLVRV